MEAITSLEQVRELKRCRVDPAYFIDKYCHLIDPVKGKIPFRLFEFQKFCIHHFINSRYNIIRKPRQMGMSNLTAAFSFWLANFHGWKNCIIISIKETVSKRFLEKIKIMYDGCPKWLVQDIVNGKPKDLGTTSLMEFANGSRIESIPTSKEAGRSEAISLLIIDEAAFVEHIEGIWAAAQPTLSQGGVCILLSTTNGIGNFYHSTWSDALLKLNNFNPIDLHYTMFPGRDEKWARKQLRDLGKLRFNQEVMCEFLSSGRTVFVTEVIEYMRRVMEEENYQQVPKKYIYDYFKDCYESDLEAYRSSGERGNSPVCLNSTLITEEAMMVWKLPENGSSYCIGVDVARDSSDENDHQALQIVDADSGELVLEYFGKLTIHQYAYLVLYLCLYYNQAFTLIENTGVGWSLIVALEALDFPYWCFYTQERSRAKKSVYDDSVSNEDNQIIGFATTKTSKPTIITNLQNAYEGGTFTQKSKRCLMQHYVFQYLSGNSMGALSGYSDDLIMASALTQECRRCFVPTTYVGARIG